MKNIKLLVILIIYIFVDIYLTINCTTTFINIINPIFFSIIICYSIIDMKRWYIRISNNRDNLFFMYIFLLTSIIIYFCTGFIIGFCKNPYIQEIFQLIKIQIVPIIGIELARHILISRNKNNKNLLIIVTLVLILLRIDYKVVVNLLSDKESFFKYICETVIPLIASNILCTYLTKEKSYTLSLAYMITGKLLFLIFPILPNVNWFILGAGNTIFPIIIYVIYKYKLTKQKKDLRKKKSTTLEKLNFIFSITISILLVCFMLGIFKYEPIAILSNSMNPVFSRGDILIFKKLNNEEINNLSNGDIIIYTLDNRNIAHRIINVVEENNEISYITKGDNNNTKDLKKVKKEQIKGKYIFHIKYVGLLSIWLNESLK